MTVTSLLRIRGVFYGWWLVAITGFVMVLATVPLFHAMSVWFVALGHTFGWNRTQLSFAFSLTRIEGGVMGPVEGYLTDRLGTRRMVLIGLLVLGCGFLFFSQVQNLWMFYLAFLLMALGQGFGSWLPMMTALNNWFVKRRATAMAWANTGSRLGALLLVPALAWAVDPEADRLGWRLSAAILGAFMLLIAWPLSRLIRNRPEEYGQRPDGDMAEESARSAGPQAIPAPGPGRHGGSSSDFTARQALRTPAFWLISVGHALTSMVIVAIMAHLGPMLTLDQGIPLQTAAWVVTAYTGVAMVFQLVGGYVGDRVPKNVAIFVFTSVQATGVLVLTLAQSVPMALLFAVLFGIGFGGRNPLTAAIRGDYFGRMAFGRILGLSMVPMNVLLLLAPPFAGYMYDTLGSYQVPFSVLAGLNLLGGVCFLLVRKPTLHRS